MNKDSEFCKLIEERNQFRKKYKENIFAEKQIDNISKEDLAIDLIFMCIYIEQIARTSLVDLKNENIDDHRGTLLGVFYSLGDIIQLFNEDLSILSDVAAKSNLEFLEIMFKLRNSKIIWDHYDELLHEIRK